MYSPSTPLNRVKGIGPILFEQLIDAGFKEVKDLLLWLPIRYEDRSTITSIHDAPREELITIQAYVVNSRNYYKGRRSIQSATISDQTGKIKVMWFNNPHIIAKVAAGRTLLFSGKINDKGFLVQPLVEAVSEDTIHTGRIIPVYSSSVGIKVGTLRRILKHILDELSELDDPFDNWPEFISLREALQHIHFPDDETATQKAMKRLALEELLGLIQVSQEIKDQWQSTKTSFVVTIPDTTDETQLINTLPSLPFQLTTAQKRCVIEILESISSTVSMNRLLLGDVGSGKTAVAGIAAYFVLKSGRNVSLIVPTQILAGQHFETLKKLFPDIHIQLLTGKTRAETSHSLPTLYVGTHAVITKLSQIEPALVIYDEQHRFGVQQRSEAQSLATHPHILTMSATPIPRSLVLSIFSHLQLSVIDEMPAGRQPTKTWLVPETKREESYTWLGEQIMQHHGEVQVIVVCPFIDASEAEGFGHVAAATSRHEELSRFFQHTKDITVALLHGRMKQAEKDAISQQLYAKKIDILVTTPIVEVGLDLPAASFIVIENAERFGLASLHQLRGRVGRAGQQGYCLLFSQSKTATERLTLFSAETNGLKVAEYDLAHRGAGNLFGMEQHGFEQLRFASWTNLELVALARKAFTAAQHTSSWKPFISPTLTSAETTPLAN